tara:strand:- start:8490 stop:8771 length:282 start_codon:yes stop_codon:yes gene_type:complete
MKSFNDFVEESSIKRCPEGKYYCHKEKKCMPIPRGYYVGARGWLTRDNQNENGNGNGNGSSNGHANGGNGNGNGGNHSGNGGSNGGGNGGGNS